MKRIRYILAGIAGVVIALVLIAAFEAAGHVMAVIGVPLAAYLAACLISRRVQRSPAGSASGSDPANP